MLDFLEEKRRHLWREVPIMIITQDIEMGDERCEKEKEGRKEDWC